MKRKFYAVFALVVVLCLSLTTVAFGYTYGVIPEERIVPLVVDDANLLSEAEETLLTARLSSIGDMNEVEIGVVTVDSLDGKSAQAFADDYYDYNGFGYGDNDDGLLVLYKDGMSGDRELYITTHGTAISVFTDRRIDLILDEMIPPIIDGDYYGAFTTFAGECEYYLENPSAVTNSENIVKEKFVFWLLGSVVFGFAVAFIIMLGVASSLKTVKRQPNAAAYVDNLKLSERSDTFLYKNVRKRPIPRSSSSGGGSSTHRSSSGRSHGGGGRRF